MGLGFTATDLDAVICTQLSNTVRHGFKIIDYHQLLAIKPFQQVSFSKLPVAIGKGNMLYIRGAGHGETDAVWRANKTGCQSNFVSQLNDQITKLGVLFHRVIELKFAFQLALMQRRKARIGATYIGN